MGASRAMNVLEFAGQLQYHLNEIDFDIGISLRENDLVAIDGTVVDRACESEPNLVIVIKAT